MQLNKESDFDIFRMMLGRLHCYMAVECEHEIQGYTYKSCKKCGKWACDSNESTCCVYPRSHTTNPQYSANCVNCGEPEERK